MNERINELRLDAGISQLKDDLRLAVIDRGGNIIDPLIGLEKFAELIVKECIDILDARRKIHTSPTYRSIDSQDRVDAKAEELVYSVMDIKEHFGVKE
jgi:hypothetical protein